MYQKRDYVIGIISFFLTLSIGIFIGATLSDNIIVKQQKEVVERLEEELISISISQNLMEEELSQWNNFQVDILPALVKNNLEGVEIAVIYGERKAMDLEVFQLLETAGAEVTREVLINPQKLEELTGEGGEKQVINLVEGIFSTEREGTEGAFDKVIIFWEGLEGLFEESKMGETLVMGLKEKGLDIIGVVNIPPGLNHVSWINEMEIVKDIESLAGQLDLIHNLHN